MIRLAVTSLLILLPATLFAQDARKPTPAPIVFFDIAGPETAKLNPFYADIFGWNLAADGQFTTTVISPLPGTIRKDPAEKRIYIGVNDVRATLAQIKAKGGTIDVPRFEVPGVVILGLFKDPAGNAMGLVEIKDGKPKVP